MTATLPAQFAETIDATPVFSVAAPYQMRAVRLLLPELAVTALPLEATLATAGKGGPIIGAAAIVTDKSQQVEGRCPVAIEVIPPWRGRGVEEQLWRAVIQRARAIGAGVVCQGWQDTADAAPPVDIGLIPVKRRYEFNISVDGGYPILCAMGERLQRNGRVPENATAVSLRDADIEAVAALHMRHFPGSLQELRAAFRGAAPTCFNLDFSVVTMVGNEVTSYAAGRFLPEESVFDVHWKAVAEPFRNSWSNLWLMYHVGLRIKKAGVTWLRYRALTHNHDTRMLIKHLGGALTREQVRYGRD